jgi:hypothetical protein
MVEKKQETAFFTVVIHPLLPLLIRYQLSIIIAKKLVMFYYVISNDTMTYKKIYLAFIIIIPVARYAPFAVL